MLQIRRGDESSDQSNEPLDSYVRGTDLVAVYASTAERDLVADIYWRAIQYDAVGAVGVEIIASVETSLLDSDPRMTVGSALPDCDILRLSDERESRFAPVAATYGEPFGPESGAGVFLFRLPGTTRSYVEMIHPADFTTAEIQASASGTERICSKFRLFNEPLEKGVIRRARVCGVWLARQGDENFAVECYRHFVQSAAPLTA